MRLCEYEEVFAQFQRICAGRACSGAPLHASIRDFRSRTREDPHQFPIRACRWLSSVLAAAFVIDQIRNARRAKCKRPVCRLWRGFFPQRTPEVKQFADLLESWERKSRMPAWAKGGSSETDFKGRAASV